MSLLDELVICELFTRLEGLDHQDRQERKDAAHECAHGRLPHDQTPPCGCWPGEKHRLQVARFREQAERARTNPIPEKEAA